MGETDRLTAEPLRGLGRFAAAGPVPLVYGVSGHRNILRAQIPELRKKLTEYFRKEKENYPHTRLILLSGLAIGADQIAAECALAEGWEVGAVLAAPIDDFVKPFSVEDRRRFREILAKCAWRTVVSDPPHSEPDCYVRVSYWIARYAHALIAIWDGVESSPKRGGTAYTVQLFRSGLPPIRGDAAAEAAQSEEPLSRSSAHLPDTGPVKLFLVRRDETDRAAPQAPHPVAEQDLPPYLPGVSITENAGALANPYKPVARNWELIRRHTDLFNEAANASFGAGQVPPPSYLSNLAKVKEDSPAGRASRLYSASDNLAKNLQERRWRRIILALGIGAGGLLTEQLYSGPFGDETRWLWVFVALMILSVLIVAERRLRGPRGDVASRFHDYRALAEASRVQYFWKRCGIPDSAADHHLTDQNDELEWIRQAVRTTEMPCESEDATEHMHSRIAEAKTQWILEQMIFFREKTRQTREKRKSLERLSWGLIAIAGLIAAAIPLLEPSGPIEWYQFGYGALLVGAAVAGLYVRLEGFAEKERNYRRMALTMTAALDKLDRVERSGLSESRYSTECRTILTEIGQAALNENSDWLLLLRERPIGTTVG